MKYSLEVWVVVVKISSFREEGILWEAAAGLDISEKEEKRDVINKIVFHFLLESNGGLNTVWKSGLLWRSPGIESMGFYEKQQPTRIFHQKKKESQDVFNKMVLNF
jgi:hypothetical protein